MSGIERVIFFGVRHFSPAASFHLEKMLNEVRPSCVLIEGPSDASDIIPNLISRNVKLPVALLAYTEDLPLATTVYPFDSYSPEYRAMVWAVRNNSAVRFIDLPASVTLNRTETPPLPIDVTDENSEKQSISPYKKVAVLAGETDYDDYYERNFEHNLNKDAYYKTMPLFSKEMRLITESSEEKYSPEEYKRNLLRESFMKREVAKALKQFPPEKIAVITGAYHSLKIQSDECVPMSDEEFENFEKRNIKVVLMPYTTYRLSDRLGYGAGTSAPEYFSLMWELLKTGEVENLPHRYITSVGRHLREQGGYCSAANEIEAIRLAQALTSLKDGNMPVLRDLHDACVACIGHGDSAVLAEAFAKVDIGTRLGEVPEGLSQTPIQDDIARELKRLKLTKYKSTVAQTLMLDLRENFKVNSKESAFIDLNRSIFFNRLSFLGINFAAERLADSDKSTWKEIWELRWTPEVDIQAIDALLNGETIELACAYTVKEKLLAESDIKNVAKILTISYKCDLPSCFALAMSALQGLAADTENFTGAVSAAFSLAQLIKYNDLRKGDVTQAEPLLKQIFLQAAFILNASAWCDDKEAGDIAQAINTMQAISQDCYDIIDDDLWVKELTKLAFRDDKNAVLSGLAFSILLERGLVGDDKISSEISRRLSPGIPAEIGAGWFDGLSRRNRYMLLSRTALWRELDTYLMLLDEEEFKRSLVFLRRAFSDYTPREKSSIAKLLGDIWGFDSADAESVLLDELGEEEMEVIDSLGDFDFDL
ncbi:MAG: DUF5682 family protein [Ruminococcus sp.]|jgi:hypothetical protein|nr:DUF5682 family protein [Ruminococcus sp.]